MGAPQSQHTIRGGSVLRYDFDRPREQKKKNGGWASRRALPGESGYLPLLQAQVKERSWRTVALGASRRSDATQCHLLRFGHGRQLRLLPGDPDRRLLSIRKDRTQGINGEHVREHTLHARYHLRMLMGVIRIL